MIKKRSGPNQSRDCMAIGLALASWITSFGSWHSLVDTRPHLAAGSHRTLQTLMHWALAALGLLPWQLWAIANGSLSRSSEPWLLQGVQKKKEKYVSKGPERESTVDKGTFILARG